MTSKMRGIKDFNRSKFNSPSSDDCHCPDTPASSKLQERLSRGINTRECRSRRNIDVERLKRNPSCGYEKSRIERGYTGRETSALPVIKVTSVDGIKSWSRDCRNRRKNGDKSVRESSSNRSSSSSIIEPRFDSTKILDNPQKTKFQNPKSRKSDGDSCGCCDCLQKLRTERLKHLNDSKRLEKFQGRFTPHPSTQCPQGSSTKTQKLCSMLKTREAKRIIGCTCINDEWNTNCSIDCRCPETPVDIPNKTLSKVSKKSTLTNDNINIDNCPSEASCSCEDSSPDQYPSSPLNLQDLQPTVAPPNDWKKCGEYLKKFSNEYRILSSHLRSIRREIDAVKNPDETYRKRITRKYPGKEFSFQVRTTGDSHRKNTSSYWKRETVDHSCQCKNPPNIVKSTADKFRRSELSDCLCDSPKGLKNFESFERANRGNRRVRGRSEKKSNDLRCNTSVCDCKPKAKADVFDKIEKRQSRNRSERREKRGIRRHDFSLPRIASVNKNGISKDDRMLIYPPKNETGCPLTLYKKGSYVNCSVEQIDDVGFKYDVAYVQRYVSLPWRPGEYSEQDVKTDYLSTDDYG